MSKVKKAGRIWKYLLALMLLLLLGNSIVICHEDEYKLIRQFGKVQRVVSVSGLTFKVPFIQSVDTVPKEMLIYDLPASDVITSDKKSMIVDSYVLWRVEDPLKFTQTLANSIYNAENRINAIVYNATKNTVSNMTQDEIIKSRDGKMTITAADAGEELESNDLILEEKTEVVEIKSLTEEIMDSIGDNYQQYGINILAVEVKKLDLPDDNKQAVYTRMISERENIAAQYTAEGASQAQIIQNTTDKEVSIMLSEAHAQAEQLIAEGEAEYMRILSDAYADETRSDFYAFVRSLDAAKESLKGSNEKTLILPADSPIARIFAGQ
ncbi:MAG: protease modulator HflC [Lachnospiraceae bacterium]|uniref:protease modulator HflC n=1 Tax=Candidatus Merdisoma sp. JLR.KK006 TaxID=3112626 RepID=UPI002FEF49D6|nr:protease modulator HflC [Lachnospiraceae bacterium]